LYSFLTTFHHSVTDWDVEMKNPQRSLNGLWSHRACCILHHISSLSLSQAWSLCSIKGRSQWCRYWPLWGAAV